MNRCLILLIPFFATIHSFADDSKCEIAAGALVKYERLALQAKKVDELVRPLACILKIQQEGAGIARVFATSFLQTMLGAGQLDGLTKDARYRRLTEKLEELTLKTPDPVYQSVIAEFARGDWEFYKLFCEQGDTSFCTDFLPDEKSVKEDKPLLAAASLLRLKNAFHVLKGKEREKVAARLKNLFKEIPAENKLQRKFIDEIYKELFAPVPTLGMA